MRARGRIAKSGVLSLLIMRLSRGGPTWHEKECSALQKQPLSLEIMNQPKSTNCPICSRVNAKQLVLVFTEICIRQRQHGCFHRAITFNTWSSHVILPLPLSLPVSSLRSTPYFAPVNANTLLNLTVSLGGPSREPAPN